MPLQLGPPCHYSGGRASAVLTATVGHCRAATGRDGFSATSCRAGLESRVWGVNPEPQSPMLAASTP